MVVLVTEPNAWVVGLTRIDDPISRILKGVTGQGEELVKLLSVLLLSLEVSVAGIVGGEEGALVGTAEGEAVGDFVGWFVGVTPGGFPFLEFFVALVG